MAPRERSILIRSALASKQVTQSQIDEAIEALRAEGGLSSLPAVEVGDERLAEKLVAMEYLTKYQAHQLKMGHTKLKLGSYVITDWLGQGGMGQVFAGVHNIMGRKVAIKVLPQNKSTPKSIENFTREIQTQAKLSHENLVHAYDAGHDGQVYFLVTEFVPGTDLRRLVRSQGPLSMRQAASVILQAASGLEYAHQQGLIHRDVKPANLLVTPEGIVKVSDLGLASFLDDTENDPRAGKIVGTPDYLSPEKITAPQSVTAVSDIYSLGCTLYYTLTGKVPFPGGSTREKARRHCMETPWHPRQFNPDVSDEFVDLIADMMEKDPSRRLQSAAEVANRLEPWAGKPSTIPTPPMQRSPWQPPSVPSEDTVDDFGEIEKGNDEKPGENDSQISQGTFPLSASGYDTNDDDVPPPPPTSTIPTQTRRWRIGTIVTALIGMVIGAVLTILIQALLN